MNASVKLLHAEKRPLRIGIVAGEASGDYLGAKLLHQLKASIPNIQIEGIGGPAMINAGCNSLFDIDRLSVMGFIDPLLRLPELIKLRRDVYQHFLATKPDLFIGVDAPDFNIGLELKLRKAGIPIVHYVSPSVWAWRQYRIHKIAKAVDLMLTILPFENQFYAQHNVPAHYVGHPLAAQIPLHTDTKAARRALCIAENDVEYVALLPGSRRQEIRYVAESMLKAAQIIHLQRPKTRFLTSHINEDRYQEFYAFYKQFAPTLPIEFFTRRAQDVMAAADAVVVTSGTATLETMLYKKPMVIVYRMSKFTYKMAQWLVKTPFAGLPNLLANEMIVPELIQDAAQPDAIAKPILEFLSNKVTSQKLIKKFTMLHQTLLGNSQVSIVQPILNIIKK